MVLKDGKATLLLTDERIIGSLRLDGRRLRFEPDEPRGRPCTLVIEIVDIKRIDRAAVKVAGLPVLPTGMNVVMRNGQIYAFAAAGRARWIEAIGHAQADTPKG